MGNHHMDKSMSKSSVYDQRQWLDELLNRLTGRPERKCYEGKYWNHPDLPQYMRKQGYYGCFQSTDKYGYPFYLMISRSHTEDEITLDQIIDDLSSNQILLPFAKFGEYYANKCRRQYPGKYATIRFGVRWYMISECNQNKPYYRLALPGIQASPKSTLNYEKQVERIVTTPSPVVRPMVKGLIRAETSEQALKTARARLAALAELSAKIDEASK